MATSTYDLLVLGDDFPGVVAATLCAARGMRVLLATTRDDPESYKVGPYKLPTRPLVFTGMASPAIRRVMTELNFVHLLKRRLRDNAPAFQFVGPDARIDVTGDDDQLAAELARELSGTDGDAAMASSIAARYVSELIEPVLGQAIAFPPTKFWDRREVGRNEEPLEEAGRDVASKTAHSVLARALCDVPAALASHWDPRELTPIARARAFDLWRRGTAILPGGRRALRDIFMDKFASHSGEVRQVVAEELVTGWNKVTGVRLRDREEVGADHVIAAMPAADLVKLLPKTPKKLGELAEALVPTAYRYTLNLVMAEEGVPEGIGATVLVVHDPNEPLIGDNAFAIHVGPPDDEARVTVTVEAVCPAPGPGTSLDDEFANLRIRLRERLEDIMPFSREHVLVAHSPNETADPEGIRAKADLTDPIAPTPAWHSELPPQLGVAAAPYQIGLKRLTCASSQILPGLGFEGELAVGWCAALLACSASKKKDYLRDEVISGAR